jgi:hypothetical protein
MSNFTIDTPSFFHFPVGVNVTIFGADVQPRRQSSVTPLRRAARRAR